MEQTDITTRGTLKDAPTVNTDITQNVKYQSLEQHQQFL